jgi:hypothetical protein
MICQTAVEAQMQSMSLYQRIGSLGRHNESSGLGRFGDTWKIHFSRNARECFAVRFDSSFTHVINYDKKQLRIQVNLDRFPRESAVFSHGEITSLRQEVSAAGQMGVDLDN